MQSFGFEAAYVQWAFNIPLFIAGVLVLGGNSASRRLSGLFSPVCRIRDAGHCSGDRESALGRHFGGVGIGVGIGMVFLGRGSTGGTALAAQIIHKYTGLSQGKCLALIDGTIVLSAMFVLTSNRDFMLCLAFIYQANHRCHPGRIEPFQMAMIITNREEEVRHAVLNKSTGDYEISAVGGYTDDERPI
ncbi:YitT family protein [Bacillus licheniformis]|nr:YitT family protein [Bacillus licheniformis]